MALQTSVLRGPSVRPIALRVRVVEILNLEAGGERVDRVLGSSAHRCDWHRVLDAAELPLHVVCTRK